MLEISLVGAIDDDQSLKQADLHASAHEDPVVFNLLTTSWKKRFMSLSMASNHREINPRRCKCVYIK